MITDKQQDSSLNYKRMAKSYPNDRLAMIYFFFIGGTSIIGWQAVQSSFDFFKAKFPESNVTFVFPLAIYVAQMILTFTMTTLSNLISYNVRILLSTSMAMLMMIIIPVQANALAGTAHGMAIIMGLLFVLGFFNTIIYASIGGLVSQLANSLYTTCFLVGYAIFTLATNLLKEPVTLMFHNTTPGELKPVLTYFVISALILSVGVVLHVIYIRSGFTESYLEAMNDSDETDIEGSLLNARQREAPKSERNLNTLYQTFLQTKWLILLFFIVCIQQTLVYPGVALKKITPGLLPQTKTVSFFFTFSGLFIFGKVVGQFRKYYGVSTVVFATLLRFVAVACFIIQAVTLEVPILNTLWFGYLNVAIFGLTLGFLNVAFFIMVPELVKKEWKEVAGFLPVFCINIGGMLGGFLALTLANLGK